MIIDKNNWFWKSVFDNKKIYNQIILASVFINLFAVASAFYIMTVYDKVVPNSAYSSLIALTIAYKSTPASSANLDHSTANAIFIAR